jgi:hypothetical protein
MATNSTKHRYCCAATMAGAIFLLSCGSGSSPSPAPAVTPPQSNCSSAPTGSSTDYSTSPVIPSTGTGCPVFPTDNPWNADVSNYCVDPNSDQYIASINQDEQYLHPDFGSNPSYGIPYIVVPGDQQLVSVTFNQYPAQSDFGTSGPGCTVTATSGCYPFPPNAPVEAGSDHHVLTLLADPANKNCMLYEVWEGVKDANDNNWTAANGAIFNLYSDKLRPDGWTSADAAGLPILPGLARYDEVTAGEIKHALRFTVAQTQAGFIHPATHYASNSNSPALPPMGLRLRLKASYDISSYTGESLVILTALKKYGMMVADNGSSWYISGATDPRWNDTDLDQLKNVPGSAFEVVVTGPIQTQSGP